MSRGAPLTDDELRRAEYLHGLGYTWREVGKLMRRDHSGLCRRVDNKRTMSDAIILSWSKGNKRVNQRRTWWD